MSTTSDTSFDDLRSALSDQGVDGVLEKLAEQLIAEKKFQELFDARLLQARLKLGLPAILTESVYDTAPDCQAQIDEALVETCREVGNYLLAENELVAAWSYLKHCNGKAELAKALEGYEPDDEDEGLDQLIEIAVHEGVHPRRGFELVLSNFGTCNSVTLFEQSVTHFTVDDRREVAGLLLTHLHAELVENLKAEISRQEGQQPEEQTIADMVADRDWLFLDDSYHIDTSHLGMVVRFGVWVTDAERLRLAIDLTEYGRRLSPQLQVPGDYPFKDLFLDHARFFAAQVGEEVDEALEFLRQKADEAEPMRDGFYAAEAYIALLIRLDRVPEALEATATYISDGAMTVGLAPTLLELSKLAGDFSRLTNVCQERSDKVGFVAGLIEAKQSK